MVWLAAAAALAVGVGVATVATLMEGNDHPACPDEEFGCVETGGPRGAIRIAALLPLTGPRAAEGREALRGIEVALARRGGTMFGHPLTLVERDDACSPERAALISRKLAIDTPEAPPIAAVIGAPCPAVTEPAAQILSDSGIPLLSWSEAEVSFIDPPPERSFFIPVEPSVSVPGFEAAYGDRYGSPPDTPWAYQAYRAAQLILGAIDRVAILPGDGEVLVPRVRLRDMLLEGA
jgi:ABC-type branched-subunit amino acid transport system substrate-binding protein